MIWNVGCYKALAWDFNFLSCVVAQLVDWLPLVAMGLSVFRGEAPILLEQIRVQSWGGKFCHCMIPILLAGPSVIGPVFLNTSPTKCIRHLYLLATTPAKNCVIQSGKANRVVRVARSNAWRVAGFITMVWRGPVSGGCQLAWIMLRGVYT